MSLLLMFLMSTKTTKRSFKANSIISNISSLYGFCVINALLKLYTGTYNYT